MRILYPSMSRPAQPARQVAMRGTFGVISSLLDAVFWPMDFEHAVCPSCQVDSGFYLASCLL